MGTRRTGRYPGRGLLGLWFVAALGLSTPGLALDPYRRPSQYNHEAFRSDNGLPQNSALALEQTTEGYLWVGTHEGLARFDGARFTVLDRGTSPQMREQTVTALAEDATGQLWVGTRQGVLRYERDQLRRMPDEGDLETVAIQGLVADGQFVWISSPRGLDRIPVASSAPRRRFTEKDGLPHTFVGPIAPDGAGGVWAGTAKALAHVFGDTVVEVALPRTEPLLVRSLLAARDGTLWIGTHVGLLALREGHFTAYGPSQGVPRAPVTRLLEDRDGNLWVGTTEGLLLRTATGFTALKSPKVLANTSVISLLEDQNGHLWVGTTNDGVHRLSSGPFLPFGEPEGLSSQSSILVLESHDGTLWVGAARGGLERMKDGVVTRIGVEQGLDDPNLRSLAEASDGALWVGTNGGAFRHDGERFTRVWPAPGEPPSPVAALFPDARAGMWLATHAALVHLHDGRASVYDKTQGFVPGATTSMAQERSGALWLGTHQGLLRFEQGTFTRFTIHEGLATNRVMTVYVDPRGTVWAGTLAGLYRLKNGQLTRFTTAQGLPDDTVLGLLLDGEDYFWMSSNKGISRVSRRELEEVADGQRERVSGRFFDERDGMRGGECNGGNQPSAWQARDGRLWFVTLRGVVAVNPKDARLRHTPPRLHIEEVRVQGQPVSPTEPLKLTPDQQELSVRFTAFVANGATRLPFRYRLEGYDRDWVDAEGRRVASYTRLPPGTYRFQVTARDQDGRWVEPPAVLEVKRQGWFYQTAWFYVLCTLGLGGVAGSIYAWRVGRLKERERWLQWRVEERTHELARANQELDAHLRTLRATQAQLVQAGKMAAVGTLAAGVGHEINNPLSYIVSNVEHVCEEAALLEREELDPALARERLREMQQVLREALMGADRVRRIVRDLKTFSRQDEDTRGPVDLRAVLDSAAKLATGELRPRAQLIREYAADVPRVEGNEPRLAQVFLNLLINAAQALPEGQPEQHEVRLVLKRGEEGQVVAEVRDTGSGIPPEVLGRIFDPFFTTKPVGVGTGLGLALCQAFITSMKGRIDVESEVGRGTVFRVTLPVAKGQAELAPRAGRAPAGTSPRGRVLIVDDDPLVSSALRRTLAREHDVEVVVSSRRALEMLLSPESTYDVILCDLMMPEMTGMDLHAQLEAAAPEQARRMVFITGGAYTPLARAFLERVSNPRVEKPFEPDALRGQLRTWVEQGRGASPGQAA